jgi:hypothetical protein
LEHEFTHGPHRYRISRQQVEEALDGIDPEVVWDLAVWVNDRWYPVKQALVAPFKDLGNRDINSRFAWRILRKLGLRLHDKKADGPLPEKPGMTLAADAETHRLALALAAEIHRGTAASADTVIVAAEALEKWLAA